jgi:hypothetical protein
MSTLEAVNQKKLPPSALMGLDQARTRLALIWLGGSAPILLIVILQSLVGKYGDRTQDAWSWLLPTLMPQLSAIVAVLGYTAQDPKFSNTVVRRSFYRVAAYLSIAYLGLVLLTILIQPLTGAGPLDLMNRSNLWMGPLQGLVASALGVLFVSRQTKAPAKEGEPPLSRSASAS